MMPTDISALDTFLEFIQIREDSPLFVTVIGYMFLTFNVTSFCVDFSKSVDLMHSATNVIVSTLEQQHMQRIETCRIREFGLCIHGRLMHLKYMYDNQHN